MNSLKSHFCFFPGFTSYGYFPTTATSNVVQAAVTQSSIDQSRQNINNYYETVNSSVSSKEGGVTQPSHAYQPAVISRQEPGSHTVINNTSPALVAQALSAMTLKDSCSMLPALSNYTGHFGHTNSHSANRFPGSNSPGPGENVYSPGETGGYVTAPSPQPNTFPPIPINRGPLLTAAFSNGYQ